MGQIGKQRAQRKELVNGKMEENKLHNMNNWVKRE